LTSLTPSLDEETDVKPLLLLLLLLEDDVPATNLNRANQIVKSKADNEPAKWTANLNLFIDKESLQKLGNTIIALLWAKNSR